MQLNNYAALWSTEILVALVVVLAAPLLYSLWTAFLRMYWTPLHVKRAFEAQGVKTLPFHLFYGNLREFCAIAEAAQCQPMPQVTHNIAPRIVPHSYHWGQKYGVPHVFWLGSQACYIVTNAEEAKDILSTKFGWYSKWSLQLDANDLLGNGLLSLQGETWAQHRRILNPAFFLDKLKAMIPTMEVCTIAMMENWGSLIETGKAVDVYESFKDLTADAIAHTAFGSSFVEGRQVFELQREQQFLMDKILKSPYMPGARFLPTTFNRHAWKINRDVKKDLLQVINNREEAIKLGGGEFYGNDLLGLMMAANKHKLQGNQKNLSMDVDDMIDECKTFFFTGHDTTTTLLTWMFLLLSMNPEWQTRMREEVITTCGTTNTPTIETLNSLKIMNMVLNETLRLYPPVPMIAREAATNIQLGKVLIPKGTMLTLPIISWHHDERYWGADADEFRPERFSEGVVKASKVAGAFMPFSMGPRVCIGQSFALLEAKVMMSTILRHYHFRLSPTYKHAPISVLTLKPQYGMPIILEKL